jgi:hypothetical protein
VQLKPMRHSELAGRVVALRGKGAGLLCQPRRPKLQGRCRQLAKLEAAEPIAAR